MRDAPWLLYGAYGYTGNLVARRAVAVGERPILAGRNEARVHALATELDLEYRVADLGSSTQLRAALQGVRAVAHCAGPFSATSRPMVDACLEAGVHYLDITGESQVLADVLARGPEAQAAGIVLLAGAGFDVVPSDCLLATVAAGLPGATELELAFRSGGGFSRGTARSALESLGTMSSCRIDGSIVPVPPDRRQLTVELGGRATRVSAISWGDIVTASHSTGVQTVFTYTELPGPMRRLAGVGGALVRTPGVGRVTAVALRRAVDRLPDPSPETRAATRSHLWARATAPDGATHEVRMVTPNSYSLTADSVVRIARRLADGTVGPGAVTPSLGLGTGFAQSLDGVELNPT